MSKSPPRVHFLSKNFEDFIFLKIFIVVRMFRDFYKEFKSTVLKTCKKVASKYRRLITFSLEKKRVYRGYDVTSPVMNLFKALTFVILKMNMTDILKKVPTLKGQGTFKHRGVKI